MPYKDGPYIALEMPNEDTGLIDRKYVAIPELFNVIWEDYIRDKILNKPARGLLRDIGLTEIEVFHMMEWLQLGKAEYERERFAR